MKKKLILHIGPHKTGTTAVQSNLKHARRQLGEKGWKYLEAFDCGVSVHALADRLSAGQHKSCLEALTEFDKLNENLILSSENFSRLRAEHIAVLARSVSSFEVTIVYYIRNPLTRLFSAWQEWVKHGYTYTYPAYLAARLANFAVDPVVNDAVQIRNWQLAFPKSEIRLFRYDAVEDIVAHFFEACLDMTPITSAELVRPNRSAKAEMTESMRASLGAHVVLLRNTDACEKYWHWLESIASSVGQHTENARYLVPIPASTDHSAFAAIELELKRNYPWVADEQGQIFQPRNAVWNSVDPNIWISETAIFREMQSFRKSVFEEFGVAAIDGRLQHV